MVLTNLINKAKGLVQKNPEKVRAVIDRVEETIDKTTGGKYSDKIHQAADTVEEQLGVAVVPEEAPADAPTEAPQAVSDEHASAESEVT
ncbi:antitoxin [Hoyosella altamirensis]|uniref:Signal transduction histidine kinase n=1 Tax=Hoyosella altamirensis TaxID=616997 RepID=A0A839RIK4_9ACTN|nr:antitoxin [Hoyosella altamirensis]MBB3036495.1 signal transduction histidine kinase [Hoyosella altamirensis]